MGLISMAMGQLMTYLVLGIVVAGVMKLFQVATELGEIKDLLGEIKRSLSDAATRPVAAPPPLASPAHLMRAVNAEARDAAELYEEEKP
jgi:hypothetical protein